MPPPAGHPRYWSEGEPCYRVLAPDVFAAESVAPVVGDVLLLSVLGPLNLVDVMPDFVEQRERQQQIPYEPQLQEPTGRTIEGPIHEELDPGWLALPSRMVKAGHLRMPRLLPPTPRSSSLPSTGESRRIGQDHLPQTGQVFSGHRRKQLGHTGTRVAGDGEIAVRLDDLDHSRRAYY